MRSTRYALILAAGYAVLAAVYIVVSGTVAQHMSASVEQLGDIERVKGIVYVVVTAIAIFLGARVLLARIEAADEQLRRRERALLNNERRVFAGLLAAAIAHDANNVLQAVLIDLHVLARSFPGDDERFRRLRDAAERLVALNRRLVATVRTGRTLHPEAVDLAHVVRDAVTQLGTHDRLRGRELRVTGDAVIPARTHPLLVHQVVSNLVINAGEATPRGGHIEVRLTRDGERALLEVHDDGPGIPAERRVNLFDALETTKAEGSGLGLFSVKSCTQALGGRVAVGDSPLGGACFTVDLPLATPE
jgi:signal transduction histidine kinase